MAQENPRYEYAKAVVPAMQPEQDGDGDGCAYSEAARMAREIVRRVVSASGGDGTTCLMIMRRAMGMTLDEIGALSGMSHIAVRKRLKKVVRSHPEMAAYMDPVSLDWAAKEELEANGMLRTHGSSKRKVLRTKGKKKGCSQRVAVVARPERPRMVQPLLFQEEE